MFHDFIIIFSICLAIYLFFIFMASVLFFLLINWKEILWCFGYSWGKFSSEGIDPFSLCFFLWPSLSTGLPSPFSSSPPEQQPAVFSHFVELYKNIDTGQISSSTPPTLRLLLRIRNSVWNCKNVQSMRLLI